MNRKADGNEAVRANLLAVAEQLIKWANDPRRTFEWYEASNTPTFVEPTESEESWCLASEEITMSFRYMYEPPFNLDKET